ncbi:MAG: hypothetical protein ACOY4Q_01800 [Bacillota bacterium]
MTTTRKWIAGALSALAVGGLLAVSPLTSSALEQPAAKNPPAVTAPQPGTGYCGGAGGGMMGGMMGAGMMQGTVVNTVYELTGIDKQEIINQRRAGKSFVEIAKTKGVTEEKLLEAVKKDHQTMIDQRVDDGMMTEEMAEYCTQNFEANIKTMLNNTTFGPKGGRGKGGQRGFGGMMQGGYGGMMRGWGQQAPAVQGQSL